MKQWSFCFCDLFHLISSEYRRHIIIILFCVYVNHKWLHKYHNVQVGWSSLDDEQHFNEILCTTQSHSYTPILMNVFLFLFFIGTMHPFTHAPIHHAFQRQLLIIIIAIAQFNYLIKLFILHLYRFCYSSLWWQSSFSFRWLTFALWLFLVSIIIYLVVHCIQFSENTV